MMTNQGHKPARIQSASFEGISSPFKAEQFLTFCISYRQNHPATFRELRAKGFRNGRRASSNEYCVKRSKLRQPHRAVAAVNMDVFVSETLEPGRGR